MNRYKWYEDTIRVWTKICLMHLKLMTPGFRVIENRQVANNFRKHLKKQRHLTHWDQTVMLMCIVTGRL